MDIFIYNFKWMIYNLSLAFLPVLFGLIALKARSFFLVILFSILWLLYLPNSLYVVTDLMYLPKQLMKLNGFNQIILLFEYVIFITLGIWAYIFSLYMCEVVLRRKKISALGINFIIFVINFLVGFGIMMGRVLRTNSWEVFTNTQRVIRDAQATVFSVELMIGAIFFCALGSIIYYFLKPYITHRFFKPLDVYLLK